MESFSYHTRILTCRFQMAARLCCRNKCITLLDNLTLLKENRNIGLAWVERVGTIRHHSKRT